MTKIFVTKSTCLFSKKCCSTFSSFIFPCHIAYRAPFANWLSICFKVRIRWFGDRNVGDRIVGDFKWYDFLDRSMDFRKFALFRMRSKFDSTNYIVDSTNNVFNFSKFPLGTWCWNVIFNEDNTPGFKFGCFVFLWFKTCVWRSSPKNSFRKRFQKWVIVVLMKRHGLLGNSSGDKSVYSKRFFKRSRP